MTGAEIGIRPRQVLGFPSKKLPNFLAQRVCVGRQLDLVKLQHLVLVP